MRSPQTPRPMVQVPWADEPVTGLREYFAKSREVIQTLPFAMIEQVADRLDQAYREDRNVFLFGNGGSAALASHFACDLAKGTVSAEKSCRRFRALSLTDNAALITAWANDSSYEQVFAEQMRNFVQKRDVAVGISASGCSPNVLLALQTAREAGATTVGLGGYKGGKLPEVCDLCIVIPSNNMQIIEDWQMAIAHALFTEMRHRISILTSTEEAKRSAAAVAAAD